MPGHSRVWPISFLRAWPFVLARVTKMCLANLDSKCAWPISIDWLGTRVNWRVVPAYHQGEDQAWRSASLDFAMEIPRFMFDSASSMHRQVGGTWRAVSAQPSWVSRIALTTFLLVLAIPIVLLVLFATIAGALVFAALASAYVLVGRFRQLLPRRDGRSNVKVIGVTRHPRDA